MIRVNFNYKFGHITLECEAGLASSVFQCIVSKCPAKLDNNIIYVDKEYVEIINKALIPFKDKICIDESFKKWRAENSPKEKLLIRVGPTYSRIFCVNRKSIPHKLIEDATKYFSTAAINTNSYKMGRWDGYIHLYNRKTGVFLSGLISKVKDILTENNFDVEINYCYNVAPEAQFSWTPTEIFTLSDDQKDCIEAALKQPRCVIKAATGFGKTSAIARYLIAKRGVPTLFIANKKVLLDDAKSDFVSGIDEILEEDVGVIKDGIFGKQKLTKTTSRDDIEDLTQPIIVATIQSLKSRLEDERTKNSLLNYLKNTCQFLMVDETQAVGTKMWDEVLKQINAPYRVFLSATPKRTDGATLKIFAYSGDLAYDTTAADQIEKGRLCEMNISMLPFDHKLYNENDKNLNYSEFYNENIVLNDERNNLIVSKAMEFLEEERQVLVLIQIIEHGEILKSKFIERGLSSDDVQFIYGKTSDKQRRKAIDDFRSNKFKVFIGSTVADAGLNIPSISAVILAGAGASDIVHVQRIGRGSRNFDYVKNFGYEPKFLKKNKKKITEVIDILDTNVAFFKKQAKARYNNAIEEFGHDRVHIIGADSSIFRYRKRVKESLDRDESMQKTKELFSAFDGMKEKVDPNPKNTTKNKGVQDLLKEWNNFN